MPTSHVFQFPPGTIQEAVPIDEIAEKETFQLIDPPTATRSPDVHVDRDTQIYKIKVSATTVGTEDSTFELLIGEPNDVFNPTSYTFTDLLNGTGILPANAFLTEWYLYPLIDVKKASTRLAVNMTFVSNDVSGIVIKVLYT